MEQRQGTFIMVISAWREDDGVRARIVHGEGAATRARACGSTTDILEAVRTIIEAWAGTSDPAPGPGPGAA